MAPRVRAPRRNAAPQASVPRTTVPQRQSTVQLSPVATYVEPHVRTTFTATVVPRRAGRLVTVKEVVGRRFVGVVTGTTNRTGEVVLSASFPHQGALHLRAFVAPTPAFAAAVSSRVVEHVTDVLPLTLPPGVVLSLGDVSYDTQQIEERLSALGYWLGTPSVTFDDATQQAVYAIQKAAGIPRTGEIDPATLAAINAGVLPTPRTTSGSAIEIDLQDDLVMIVQNGKLAYVLNTSTGGGYTYTEDGATDVATTPTGIYAIQRVVDGSVTDTLGTLWRPRFFFEGYAIHGDSYVPPEPESHGCARVSNEAIDWIWADNIAPIGMEVWVYN
jgi:peptidoglycan hydrolase-like protein with peptidoglycan-binding domain